MSFNVNLNKKMAPPIFFNYYGLWIELIYSLIVVLSCFLIYFKTKEMYKLTSYKGIKYFRNTFLFFGITYFVRFFLHLIRTLMVDRIFGIFEIAFFVMIYSSSMALIYLIYSLFWKKLAKYPYIKTSLFHIASLIIAFISIISEAPFIFLIFQGGLFILLTIISYLYHKKTKHKESFFQLYLIYLLIFVLWIISNILEFVVYFSPNLGLIIYGISILLFLIILFRVLKKVDAKG